MSNEDVTELEPQSSHFSSRRGFLERGLSTIKVLLPFNKTAPNEIPDHLPSRRFSRRTALKAGLATALLAAGVKVTSHSADKDNFSEAGDLPEDTLTEEELSKAHIKIYQAPEVKLHLRKEALDLPVFKDAKEKKIEGVVITLIDASAINWDSVGKLPNEPRSIWEATQLYPEEYRSDYWDQLREYYQQQSEYQQGSLTFWERDLDDVISGKKGETLKRLLENRTRRLREDEDDLQLSGTQEGFMEMLRKRFGYRDDMVDYSLKNLLSQYKVSSIDEALQIRLEDVRKGLEQLRKDLKVTAQDIQDLASGAYEKRVRSFIQSAKRTKQDAEDWLEVLSDRKKAVEKATRKQGTLGWFIRPQNIFQYIPSYDPRFTRAYNITHGWNQDWGRKAYLYICVGEDSKPSPDQSYPQPNWFKSASEEFGSNSVKKSYDIFSENGQDNTGFTLRHEVSHYKLEGGSHNEYEADHGALDSITSAWERYQENGDTSGYAFVFATKEGLVITKRNNEQPQQGLI